jgi:hypothetical protein
MRHQPEVADADESWREHMQEEPAKELIDGQGHEPLFVFVSRIAPAEGDQAIGERYKSMV